MYDICVCIFFFFYILYYIRVIVDYESYKTD